MYHKRHSVFGVGIMSSLLCLSKFSWTSGILPMFYGRIFPNCISFVAADLQVNDSAVTRSVKAISKS